MALDTASVQQPGFNVQFDPNPMQNREILDNSGFTGAVKSVADVLQKRQDEVRDSYDKMTSALEEVDARDQADFLGIIEENRNQLKQLARKGVNNREYIAAKAKIFADLASKKKISESYSSQIAEAQKIGMTNKYIYSDKFREKLNEISSKPLAERTGNEVQSLLSDPNIYNAPKMVRDAVIRTVGKDVTESYAIRLPGGDIEEGSVTHSPLLKIKKNKDGSPVIDKQGNVEFEYHITPDLVDSVIGNTDMPGIVKSFIDLVNPKDNLDRMGSGDHKDQAYSADFMSIIAQAAGDPVISKASRKMAPTSGATTAAKNLKEEESIASIADAIKSQNTKKLASSIGAESVTFVSPEENKYLVPGLGKNKPRRLADKGKPEEKWSGIFIVKKDGTVDARSYDPSSPGTLAAKLYEENKANLVAGEKENEGATTKKSIADMVREAAKNKK